MESLLCLPCRMPSPILSLLCQRHECYRVYVLSYPVHAKPFVSFIESVLLCSGHFLASVKVNIHLLSFLCSVLFNFYLSLTNFYTLYSYQAHEESELSDFPPTARSSALGFCTAQSPCP